MEHTTEMKIIGGIVRRGLARGLTIGVWDGEEWALRNSADYNAVMCAIGATEETVLYFRRDAQRVGAVYLVHGLGNDVVCDHTDNALFDAIVMGE